MNGSIYDFGLQRSTFTPHFSARDGVPAAAGSARSSLAADKPVGLISNPRSRRNKGAPSLWSGRPDVIGRAPATRAELRDVLQMFAARGIDLLVIDGGDGTVRDVLTCAGDVWRGGWPDIILLPAGKTNALAGDIGVPANWGLDDGLAAAARGRIAVRTPLEITPADDPAAKVRGFIFGAGAFVDATALAQRTHRAGAFNGIAVALALGWGLTQTAFGGPGSAWRTGSRVALDYDADARRMHHARPDGVDDRYLVFASTLHHLPTGVKPFGKPRGGLKTLVVDVPPRRLALLTAPLLLGSQSLDLERGGYHRVDAKRVTIDIPTRFILDGETFPPGAYILREAEALRFVVA